MKKRILYGIWLTSLISVILSTVLMSISIYNETVNSVISVLKVEADYISTAYVELGESYFSGLDKNLGGRVTIVSDDGSVLYDSVADPANMENHSDRPEIIEALENGYGSDTRLSETIDNETIYYAEKIDDNTVVRVSSTMQSIYASLYSQIPWLIVICLAVGALSLFISRIETKHIVKPINEINLDSPRDNEVYDELSPLLVRMQQQKNEIDENVSTLTQRQNEFSTIIKNMTEGLIIVDKNADVLSYNNSATKFCNYTGNFTIGSSVFLMNRDIEFSAAVDNALLGKGSVFKTSVNDKQYKYFINPVDSDDGAVILIMDTTEQASRENMRREFTANVSHELKTPLTSISGYAEIIKTGIAKEEDICRFADKIYTEAQKLISLVADIIKLSRLDESDGGIEKERCDLYKIAENVVYRLEDSSEKAEVTMVLRGESTKLLGIPAMLEEMVYNLCDNAIKYNKQGGHVYVHVYSEKGQTMLNVRDTGIGIPDTDKERIFERFYRVDKSHNKQTGGTGLGLSIVKHCAMLHDGEIKLESVYGEYTDITVTFDNSQEIHIK